MELPEAAALSKKHAAATAWAAEAQALLDRGRHFADEDARMLEVSICCVSGVLRTNMSLFSAVPSATSANMTSVFSGMCLPANIASLRYSSGTGS